MTATVCVIAALKAEIAPLVSRLEVRDEMKEGGVVARRGVLAGREVVLASTGDGAQAAKSGSDALFERWPADALLVAGVAGGLSPGMGEGRLVTAVEVRDLALGEVHVASADFPGKVPAASVAGVVATADRIAWRATEKERLWRRLGRPEHAVVDLESAVYVRLAESRGIPWRVLRAVIDPADEDLILDFNRFRGADGRVEGSRVLRHVALRPQLAGALLDLRRRLGRCADVLAPAVLDMLEVLHAHQEPPVIRGRFASPRALVVTVALLLAAPAARAAPATEPAAEEPALRTLFIMLDAVAFSVVERVTSPERGDAALFAEFQPPVPLISTFPSSTSVAAGGLLAAAGLEPSPGYEARFYDWSEGRVRGGGLLSYHRIDFPWRGFFDWNRSGVVASALNALWPVRASARRFRKGIAGFLSSTSERYWVYVEATDSVAHLMGPEALERVFAELDRQLRAARREHPEARYRVVVFSDHGIAGGEPLVNVYRPVRRAITNAGFSIRKRVRAASDVALTPFGLVSNFEIYTRPERRGDVIKAVVAVPGVDLCVREAGEGWEVHDAGGSASFERRISADGGEEWIYRPAGADPLGYGPPGGLPLNAWVAASAWREATASHRYPDALRRLAGGFELVGNAASIICSAEPGYMFGRPMTAEAARLRGSRLRWTHGALFDEATLGFVLTDDPSWSPAGAVGFDGALLPFLEGSDKIKGPASVGER